MRGQSVERTLWMLKLPSVMTGIGAELRGEFGAKDSDEQRRVVTLEMTMMEKISRS